MAIPEMAGGMQPFPTYCGGAITGRIDSMNMWRDLVVVRALPAAWRVLLAAISGRDGREGECARLQTQGARRNPDTGVYPVQAGTPHPRLQRSVRSMAARGKAAEDWPGG